MKRLYDKIIRYLFTRKFKSHKILSCPIIIRYALSDTNVYVSIVSADVFIRFEHSNSYMIHYCCIVDDTVYISRKAKYRSVLFY